MRAVQLAIALAASAAAMSSVPALAQSGSQVQSDQTAPPASAASVVPSSPADVPALELVCHGQGTHVQVGLSALFAFSGRRAAQGFGVSGNNIQGADAVRVRIKGPESAVRLPRDLYASKLHNSAPDGWLKLTEVETTPKEIKGKIDLFFTSHPQLRIDRDTGDIEINGNGDFAYAGNCDKAPAPDAAPKF